MLFRSVEIEIEMSADIPVGGQTSSEGAPLEEPSPQLQASTSAPAPEQEQEQPRRYTKASHFYRFRRHGKTLAVTDLTGPAW